MNKVMKEINIPFTSSIDTLGLFLLPASSLVEVIWPHAFSIIDPRWQPLSHILSRAFCSSATISLSGNVEEIPINSLDHFLEGLAFMLDPPTSTKTTFPTTTLLP